MSRLDENHITEFEMNFMKNDTTENNLNIFKNIMESHYQEEENLQQSKQEIKSKSNIKESSKIPPPPKTIKYKYKFILWKYLLESLFSFGITIGILFLFTVAPFPFFYTFFIFGLILSIKPFSFIQAVVIVCMISMLISNYFLSVEILSYPEGAICYISLYFFKQKHKKNICSLVVLTLYIATSFIIIAIYSAFTSQANYIFYYIFPIIMIILKLFVGMLFWLIDHSNVFFIQFPLFQIGLFVGVMLSTQTIDSVEFWYLILFFTLFIVNDRTQFILSLLKKCFSKWKKKPGVLPAHASGHTSLQTFYLVGFVYMLCYFQVYSSPYTNSLKVSSYVEQEWMLPLIIFIFSSIYEVMSLLLMRKKEHTIIIGYKQNGWKDSVERVFMGVVGLWLFYIGFGIGAYIKF